MKEMLFNPSVTMSEMAQKTGIKFRTLQRHVSHLQAVGIIVRKNGRKDGNSTQGDSPAVPGIYLSL